MADPILNITVFVASPGDVKGERKAVRDAAAEVNRTVGEREGFRLTVKGWETHTRPGAGRPQGVINDQIGPYDIFVGIMWARLGSPSGKAASGTVEEYEIARAQWKRKRKHKPSVLFYFRSSAPRKMADIDPAQFQAVTDFKRRVFADNLAREYATVKEFGQLIREHLIHEARAVMERDTSTLKAKPRAAAPKKSPPPKKGAPKKAAPKETAPPKKKAAPQTGGPTKAPVKKPRAPRKAPLSVPRVPKTITAADHEAFARKAFRSVRDRFQKTVAAFNRGHDHARITLAREGNNAFTAEAVVEGKVRSFIRIAVEGKAWGDAWLLAYEEMPHLGYPMIHGIGSRFVRQETVETEEQDRAVAFRAAQTYWDDRATEGVIRIQSGDVSIV